MLICVEALKCIGKDKGKMLRVFIQQQFEYKTCDEEQATFTAPGLTKLSHKVLVVVSCTYDEWCKAGKDVNNLKWDGRKFYAYDV